MAHSSYKTPRAWGPDLHHESWKTEVEMWDDVTDLAKEKKAPAVALSLSGAKHEPARAIPLADLKAETGLKSLLYKLKSLLGRDLVDEMFHDYEMFEKLRRGNKPTIEFITLLDTLYQKLVKHKLVLPSAFLACKLLSCSDSDEREKKLASSATPQLTYEEMKSSFRRIFSSSVASVSALSGANQIIKESVFVSAKGGSSKTYQRLNIKLSGKKGSRPTGTNPLNKDGRVSTCAVCGSRFHWANACPDKEKSALVSQEADAESKQIRETNVGDGTAYINLAMITGSVLQESFGKGVLDSACTVTVSGFTGMEDYFNRLSPEQRELVSVQPSDSHIVFGGGERVCAKKKYTIPIRFGDTSFMLTPLVIPGDLPLLISVGSMTKACFVINFAKKTLYTSEKFPIQLSMSTKGTPPS